MDIQNRPINYHDVIELINDSDTVCYCVAANEDGYEIDEYTCDDEELERLLYGECRVVSIDIVKNKYDELIVAVTLTGTERLQLMEENEIHDGRPYPILKKERRG